jgi:hypothetical protein
VSVSLFQPLRMNKNPARWNLPQANPNSKITAMNFILNLQSVSCLLKGSCLALKRHWCIICVGSWNIWNANTIPIFTVSSTSLIIYGPN